MKIGQTQQQNTSFGNHTLMRFLGKPIQAKEMCKTARKMAVEQGKITKGNAGLTFILTSDDEKIKTRILVIDESRTDELTTRLLRTYTEVKRIISKNSGKSVEAKLAREQARDWLGSIIYNVAGQNETARIAHKA